MDLINNSNYSIILGSGSTRRRELLEMTGISFQVNSNRVIIVKILILVDPALMYCYANKP